MILPVGHVDTELRRFPWLTTLLVALTVAAFAYTWWLDREGAARVAAAHAEAFAYFEKHPYLTLTEEAGRALFPDLAPEARGQELADRRENYPYRVFEFQLAMDQPELDRRLALLLEARAERPAERFGLVPASATVVGWLAHPFIHAEPAALAVSLLFLFMAGYSIEERWGRVTCAVLFAASAALAAMTVVARDPAATQPWIGASGAVAGLLGAFTGRFGFTRIRCAYWLLLYRGTFHAPALLLVALWAGAEVALASYRGEPVGEGRPAEWALAASFGFGFVAAVLIRFLGIEKRYLEPGLEAQAVVADNTVVGRALALREKGKGKRAFTMLQEALEKDAANGAVALALWETAKDVNRCPDAVPLLEPSLRRDVQAGRLKGATKQLREISQLAPETRVEPALLAALADKLLRQGSGPDAAFVVTLALPPEGEAWPGPIAGRLVRVARGSDPELARQVEQIALRSKDLGPELRAELEALAEPEPVFATAEASASEAADPAPEDEAADPALEDEAPAADVFDYGAVELSAAPPEETAAADAGPIVEATPFEEASTFELDDDFLSDDEKDPEP